MGDLGGTLFSIVFDGLAYGMVLFIISVGLSVTMGLMGFVNLAHGAFAMLGGYCMVVLMSALGIGFVPALLAASVIVGLLSILLERLLYQRVYGGTDVDQVMLTIGILFMTIASLTFFFGPEPQVYDLPELLEGNFTIGEQVIPSYRSFIIVAGLILFLVLWLGLDRTSFGARVRAAVDNQRMAESVGINVNRIFLITFAVGSGLAALGGGLASEVIGMTPRFGLQYLVFFLIVVAVGGLGSIRGAFYAAITLGVIDNAGKYFFPQGGAFFIYAATIGFLLWKPDGLFGKFQAHDKPPPAEQGESALPVWMRGLTFTSVTGYLNARDGFRWIEVLPWLIAVAVFFVFPDRLSFAGQVLIMILFALSLDLIFGYAGLITLGHAAYFGIGAYATGLASAHYGISEPFTGLLIGLVAAALVGLLAGAVLTRYRGLTLLMLTLASAILVYEFVNINAEYTGGFDGLTGITVDPLFGVFEYDLWGTTFYWYILGVLFVCFLIMRVIVKSWFGGSLVGIRENAARMRAVGCSVTTRLTAAYVISAALAGVAGALYTQSNQFVNLGVLSFERSGIILTIIVLAGAGRLYGAFIGAAVFMILEDEVAKLSPEFWEFFVGLLLVVVVLFARGGLLGLVDSLYLRWFKRSSS